MPHQRHVLWIVPLLLLLLVGATVAQDEQGDACPPDFSGYLPPRLTVGASARVLTIPLNMRPAPTTSQARLTQLEPATTVRITGGPRCNEGYVWWAASVGELDGWLAEGLLDGSDNGIYYLEPRGAIWVQVGADGLERRYVERADGTLEPEGCIRPPDDMTRVQLGYATLNARTLFMLDQASRLYRDRGGVYDLRDLITQGSYNPGGVDASFGTHDGGGAVDISVRSPEDWSIMWGEIPHMVEAMRIAGFAAWVRDTGELYPDSPIHIHAIAVGDPELSPIARAQVDGERGYLRGYNGLPESYGLPRLDAWGDPVVCGWMIDDGFPDLRDAATFVAVGEARLRASDFEAARDNFDRAITLDDDPALLLLRALAYDGLGDEAAAAADRAAHAAARHEG